MDSSAEGRSEGVSLRVRPGSCDLTDKQPPVKPSGNPF